MSSAATVSPAQRPIGIIGGTSLLKSSYFAHLEKRIVETPYGNVILHFGTGFIFCQRHHADPDKDYTPPHLINTRAIVYGLHQSGVHRVLSFGSTGSLRKDLVLGTVVFPDDFFNLFNQISFFTDARSHIVTGIDLDFRRETLEVIKAKAVGENAFPIEEGGTYVQTSGPRFETKAEIRVIARYGDIVAMTAAHEVALLCELGMKSALICMVDNFANGIEDKQLTLEEFREGVRKNEAVVEKILGWLLEHFVVTA